LKSTSIFITLLAAVFLILLGVGLASDMHSIPPPLDTNCQFAEAEVRKEQPSFTVDAPPPGGGDEIMEEQESLATFAWDQLSPRVGFGLTGSRDAETWARRLGAGWYLDWREAGVWITPVGGMLLAVMVLANAWAILPHVDASQDQRATDFGRKILETAPQDAVLYTLDDEDTFPLWYYHFALGERPDLAILQIRLLPEDWYRQTMRATYPGLVIPEQVDRIWYLAVMAANPNRPNCETLLDKPEVLNCKP